jgi:hypothetical protein
MTMPSPSRLAGDSTTESPPPARRKKYDTYISYSHRDKNWVEADLIPRLKKARLSVFVDSNELKPGDQWHQILSRGIRECRSILLVISPAYFESMYTQSELENAINQSKIDDTSIIPVRIAGVRIPDPLSGIQYIDFEDYENLEQERQEKLWNDLISAIRKARSKSRTRKQTSVKSVLEPDKSSQASASDDVDVSGKVNVTLEPQSLVSEGKVGEPAITTVSSTQPSEPEEEIEVHGRALSDTYSEEDLLGYQDYVDALADFVESSETKKPITVGIDAPWGGGKTTIMRMLEKRLGPPKKLRLWQKENDKGKIESSRVFLLENIKTKIANGWRIFLSPRTWMSLLRKPKRSYFYTVWFNAWRYDQEESLWAALVLEILKQVRQQLGFWRKMGLSIKLNMQRFKWDDLLLDFLKSFLFVIVIALLALVVAAGVAIASGDTIQNLSKAYVIGRIKVINTLGIMSLVSLTYTVIKDVLGKIVSPFSLGIAKYFKKPDYESKIGFLGQFQEDFKSVVATVSENGKWPLLIFIDDLDRCMPNKAAAVIESINLLLGSEHCVFVIGMDSHVLASSIQAKYKELQEFFRDPDNPGGLSLGHKFLEKIIQIDFRVPTPDPEHVNDFIDISLGRNPALASSPPEANEPQRLLQAEQRAGKSLEEAKQAVQQSNPELAKELDEAAKEIEARSFDDNDEVQKSVREAAPYLDYNPRKIKRYINLYRLQALIAYRREVLENTVSLEILGRWILIALRWPEFFDESLEHPNLPSNFLELAKKLKSATTATKRKTVLDNITESSLKQDRIKLLLDNQDIVQLLSTIPLLPDKVKNYLQLVQLSGPTQENEQAQLSML